MKTKTKFVNAMLFFLLFSTKGLYSLQLQEMQSFWKVVAEIKPAVVLIIADTIYGSGFIISKDGYIVTNEHVVKSSNNIKVYINNRDEYSANVIKSNKEQDWAILKVNASGLTTVKIGKIKKLHEGDEVAVTGYPEVQKFLNAGFAIQPSTTKGTVSAILLQTINRGDSISYIQTDAATNPGNSGGPLYLVETGEVMGIARGKLKDSERLGLAICIDIIQKILADMDIELQSNPSTPLLFAKPEPVTPTRDLTEIDYLIRGNEAYNKRNYDQAIADYNKALEINPESADAYNNRGAAYDKKGNYDQAIADCNKALQINPESAEAYNNRGIAYDGKGNFNQAIADYNKALEINPKYADAYNNRGAAYQGKGNYDQAIADCNKALEINPEYAHAYNNRGAAYDMKGNYDQAIADYNEALEINPKDADVYFNRGSAYDNKGNYDQAIADYNEALEIDPKYAKAYNNRGVAYYNKGNNDQAIADYIKALEIDPKHAIAYYNSALCYKKLGMKAMELLMYNRFVEYAPKDDPNLDKARKRIRELEK
jgi:tetratricopeptide (TPR) repeat protein